VAKAGVRDALRSANRSRDAVCAGVSIRLEHVAVWVRDIDLVASFYARYFDARIGERYRNPRKDFESRFLSFDGGARLELMSRGDITTREPGHRLGFAHVALAVGGEAAVDALAARLAAEGITLLDGPRRTGDGYYECVVRDPEGNCVEVSAT
jgi:lactoylglutathione lyase